jgi:hypothetical protein
LYVVCTVGTHVPEYGQQLAAGRAVHHRRYFGDGYRAERGRNGHEVGHGDDGRFELEQRVECMNLGVRVCMGVCIVYVRVGVGGVDCSACLRVFVCMHEVCLCMCACLWSAQSLQKHAVQVHAPRHGVRERAESRGSTEGP